MKSAVFFISKAAAPSNGLASIGTFLLGLRHIMPGEASRGGSFNSFCPFGAIETLLPYLFTGHTLKTTNLLNFSVMLGVLGVALVAGRAFCGWMCPLGTIQDWLASLGRRLSGEKQHIRGKQGKAWIPLHLPKSGGSKFCAMQNICCSRSSSPPACTRSIRPCTISVPCAPSSVSR